jgi:hypothetical protein
MPPEYHMEFGLPGVSTGKALMHLAQQRALPLQAGAASWHPEDRFSISLGRCRT